jgi:hypothetical protein
MTGLNGLAGSSWKGSNIDALARSLKKHISVIPVQTGIQSFQAVSCFLDPRLRGDDDFLRGRQYWISNYTVNIKIAKDGTWRNLISKKDCPG